MTSELRPAVEVWKEAHSAYCGPYDRNGWYTEAAVAVIEADREAVRAEVVGDIVAWLRSHGFMALDEAADKIETGEWER